MNSTVLDTSALIALIMEEPGADKVRATVKDAAMSAVNFAEVVGYFARNGAPEPEIREILSTLRIDPVPFDITAAFITGMLLPTTRTAGLSLGDRACLALALQLRAKVLTADRAWTRIAGAVGVEVELIR